jgi:hypothetical protein
MDDRRRGLGLGLVALIGLSCMLVWLDFRGFLPQDLEFLGAKALVARYGPEPRMQSIGFVFPPLLVYGTLALGSPITLQVLMGALVVGCLARRMMQLPVSHGWRWTWIILMVLHPAFAFMLLLSPSWTVATALLMWLCALLWDLVHAESALPSTSFPRIFALVLVGLGMALLVLLRYESWLLLPLVGVIVGLVFQRESWPFSGAAMLTTLFMSVVAIAAWLYVNWLFTGDAGYFLNSPYSGWRLPGTDMFVQQAGVFASWGEVAGWMVYVAPVYLTSAAWLIWRDRRKALVSLLLVIPIVFPVAAFWQGNFTPQLSRFGLFLGLLPLLWQQCPPSALWQRLIITAMLVLSLIGGAAQLQRSQCTPEETFLWRDLTGQPLPEGSSAQQWGRQQQAKRRVAQVLFEYMQPGQRVLMDDVMNFAVVYLVNDPRYFLMPYQYEFAPALQQPDRYTDFILIAGPESSVKAQDRVLQFWPQLDQAALPKFTELVRTPYYRVLQRVTSP